MTEQLLTPAQAGDLLAMTTGALAQLRYLGTGPRFVRVSGRSIRYRSQDLDEWIETNLFAKASTH
jgi:predicted DNA-binding transcriptional regulator AlpA